jgi:glycosyltransferase involved in cell wall biosynthesis
MVKVSVSVTTYNQEEFIAQAIASVLLQRVDFPYEIIIGDDCSTDGTSRIVDNIQRAHPQLIRVIRPPKNLGDNGRLIFVETLKAARGKYIAMLDGDDYWLSESKLATQLAVIEADPACTMTYHNVVRVFDDGREPKPYNSPQHPQILTTDTLLQGNCVPGCSPMIRADVISDFPPWFYTALWGDWPMYLLATEAGTVRYINEILGAYRIHSGGAWNGLPEETQMAALIIFLESLMPFFGARHAASLQESLSLYRAKLLALQSGAAGKASPSS